MRTTKAATQFDPQYCRIKPTMKDQDQKPAPNRPISLTKWLAYLPYKITVKHPSASILNIVLTTDNVGSITANDDYSRQFKPCLKPMNQFNLLQINSLLSTIDANIGYSLAGFYKIGFTHEMLELSVEELPYKVVQSLLKNRYDIFNLIPQGLALPIE